MTITIESTLIPDYAISQYKALEESTQKIIRKRLGHQLEWYLDVIDMCESPIETMFYVALQEEIPKWRRRWGTLRSEAIINPQTEINIEEDCYRVDFLIAGYLDKGGSRSTVEIVVECDGHEFHEKTKEQAARDKSRDRKITGAGYVVVRFTGSEIYNHPHQCAKEVKTLLAKHLEG